MDKTNLVIFFSILLRPCLAMGIEESYLRIAEDIYLQDSPHLLRTVDYKKGDHTEVNMREKDNISEKEEKIGEFAENKFSGKF